MFNPATVEKEAASGSGRRWHHHHHHLDGSMGSDALGRSGGSAKKVEKAADNGGGGGGFFGFFRSKPAAPVQPTVREGRERSWGDDDSPMKHRRKSRSNSFSLTITRRNREIASGRQAAPSIDGPESANDAADVRTLMAKGPMMGNNAGANSDDMYSA